MEELERLKEMYLEEIKKITKNGELSPVVNEAANKSLDAIKKIDEICCKYEEESEEGYSQRMYPRRYPMSRRMPDMMHVGYGYDRSYDRSYNQGYNDGYNRSYNDGYNDGYSDRRGRSMTTGRYISRHAAPEVDGMIHKLEDMRVEAPNSEIRMAIDNMIEKLENY